MKRVSNANLKIISSVDKIKYLRNCINLAVTQNNYQYTDHTNSQHKNQFLNDQYFF